MEVSNRVPVRVFNKDSDLSDDDIAQAIETQWGVWVRVGEWSDSLWGESGLWGREGTWGGPSAPITPMEEQPTHLIVFSPAYGKAERTFVHLDEGLACSRREIDGDECSWSVNEDGEWHCQGSVTPGGAVGTVEIFKLGEAQ